MNCADFEVLLCDYLDGTLDAAQRQAIEEHQRQCASCAEFAKDVAGAVSYLSEAAPVEPPPELLTRITFEIPTDGKQPRGWRSFFSGWLRPVLQPKFAMGMAMTILSFSMLGRIAGIEVRQIKAADLHPAKVWAAADDKIHRAWGRAVKYYENLRLVYEVQTRVQEWTQQEEEERKDRAAQPIDPGGQRADEGRSERTDEGNTRK
jgi:hypothetical protein